MKEQTELEFLLERYEMNFRDKAPKFDANFSEDELCELLKICLRNNKNLSELSELDFLKLQYEVRFGENLDYDFETLWEEQELLAALRDCLASNKPYKSPNGINSLVEQGVVF